MKTINPSRPTIYVLIKTYKPRVELEYENMIDAGGPPAVDVDAHEEDEEDEEQRPAVQPYHHIELTPRQRLL